VRDGSFLPNEAAVIPMLGPAKAIERANAVLFGGVDR
jgi:hypothetical protein